ncbi:Hypothetical protein FKW44_017210 [Caligus rogercresseyi]|uniref:Uncharacterized protein n=1 Tax=Caligus rogercresseyi TaxID=217165 RepID=A0A7T8K109_CALRO|nr:Hypothetical protein FKW44_017210 [Caligus rogercresseyi]
MPTLPKRPQSGTSTPNTTPSTPKRELPPVPKRPLPPPSGKPPPLPPTPARGPPPPLPNDKRASFDIGQGGNGKGKNGHDRRKTRNISMDVETRSYIFSS